MARTPVGRLSVWASRNGIRRIVFARGPDLPRPDETLATGPAPGHLQRAVLELRHYFEGLLKEFTVPVDLAGASDFRRSVWTELVKISFGTTLGYGDLANRLGLDAAAARAVGQAIGANPLPIVIPCHRVIAADGRLHGFSGGLSTKARLLRHEGLYVEGEGPSARVRPDMLDLGL